MSGGQAISLLKETYSKWSEHEAPRLGASVAFYSLLSFAPLLILVTALIGLVFDQASARGALVGEAQQVIGAHGAETVQSLLKNSQKPVSGIFSSVVAFITLLFGASGVFSELESALNVIWEAPERTASGFWGTIKQRLFSFGMVLSVGFLLLVSLVLSTGLAYMGHAFSQILPLPAPVLQVFNFVVSFLIIGFVFALMFKYVPNTEVQWRYVIRGALGTAILFAIGKLLLGLYLGKASVGSAYGTAGSLVAVIVWIYYSAQIFFFGGEFTHVYAQSRGAEHEHSAGNEEKPAASPGTKAAEAPAPMLQPVQTRPSSAVEPVPNTVSAPPALPAPVHEVPLLTAAAVPTVPTAGGKSLSKLAMALSFGFLLGWAFAPNRREQ